MPPLAASFFLLMAVILLACRVIGPKLFAILVIMAVVTKLMASPRFERVYGKHSKKTIATIPETLDA